MRTRYVYLLVHEVPYEGTWTLGIYAAQYAAEDVLKEKVKKGECGMRGAKIRTNEDGMLYAGEYSELRVEKWEVTPSSRAWD